MDLAYYSALVSKYAHATSSEHRKKYAQFFTPYPIAKFMVEWVLRGRQVSSFLDPAAGLGVFAALASKHAKKIDAYEIDSTILEFCNRRNIYGNVSISKLNYLSSGYEKYDAIVCNPPYKKIQKSQCAKDYIPIISKKASIPLSGLTNLYALFLIKSLLQLNERGRCAFIIPSEFLNSDYGIVVKKFLIAQGALRTVIVFDFNEIVFEDALTTGCILLFDNTCSGKVQFCHLKNISEFASSKIFFEYDLKDLSPEKKWREYYQKNKDDFPNTAPFKKWGKVMRGIATGDNNFFLFNRTKQEEYSIPYEALIPCITSAKDVSGSFFSYSSFQKLFQANKRVFLFNALGAIQNPNVARYIKFGEELGIQRGFLTSRRKPWFALERKAPAPIWVSVFNRASLRFIKNEAQIASLTSFHQVYLNPNIKSRENLFFAYLQTRICKDLMEQNRREYAYGLKKFEPNDINNAQTVNFDSITFEEERMILSEFNHYKRTGDEAFLLKVNDLFLKIASKPPLQEKVLNDDLFFCKDC